METPERRVKDLLSYWPLIAVAAGGIVTAINFYSSVNQLVSDQKAFKATVDARRDQHTKEMEEVRTRLTKLEQQMEDQHHGQP